MLFKANQMPPVLGGNPLSGGVQSQNISSNIIQQSQQQPTQPPPLVGGPPMPVPGPNFNVMQGGDIDLRAMSGTALGGPGNMDPRQMDPRMSRNIDQDMRAIPNPVPPPLLDPRAQRQMPPQQVNPQPSFPTDPRRQIDPRLRGNAGGPPGIPGPTMSQQQQTAQQQLQNRLATNCGIPNDATDQEKAALIMQVLQLSDEQISQLPPEQRASILVLKEQIAKSTQR